MGTPGVGAGDPDGLDRLWSPDRLAYIQGENRPAHDEAGEECPFCRAPATDDEEGLVVARGRLVYAVLNLYPYNTGHLMVCPYRHTAPGASTLTHPELVRSSPSSPRPPSAHSTMRLGPRDSMSG